MATVTPEYQALIETANLDWLVMTYVNVTRRLCEHSSHEVIAAAIAAHAEREYGEQAFRLAVANY